MSTFSNTAISLLAFSLIFASFSASFASADLSSEYSNSAYLDEAKNYKLYWRIDNTKELICFAVEVKTLGWVGFGISSGNGNMVGSDVVIGWVKDNKGFLKDRYADALSLPVIDDKQDYNLTAAYEQNGQTVLKFCRKYDTCDKRDVKIEQGTVRVVYGYHSKDPDSQTTIPEHEVRGTRSLILRNILRQKPELPNDLQDFEIRLNTTIHKNYTTTYTCKAFKIPEFNGTKKHVVKISPIITPGNEGMVHHILVYGCKDDFPESNLSIHVGCYSSNMPLSYRSCIGQSTVAAWAIGGNEFYFPGHVGYPIGDDISVKYVVMEIHYDNPDRKSGVKDMSGLRFHYTSSLRQYDAGVLWVGWGVGRTMMIPPRQKNWTMVGYCPSECTKLGFQDSVLPEKGIKVFASLLHAHLLGAALWTKHIRNGKELPEIARDNHYDFNFQEYQIPPKETHILPGDDIIQYCQYDSSKRTKSSYGGLSTYDEMCLSFMYYYPRINLTTCESRNYAFFDFYRRTFQNPDGSYKDDPAKLDKEWKKEWLVELENDYASAKEISASCMKQKEQPLKPVHRTSVPKPQIKEPLKIPNNCPSDPRPESDGIVVSGNTNLVAMVFACSILLIYH